MYLLKNTRRRAVGRASCPDLLQLLGKRLKKVRRLKDYGEALRDCIDILWSSPGEFPDEERRVAKAALDSLMEAWATGCTSLKDLRRIEASRHLHG